MVEDLFMFVIASNQIEPVLSEVEGKQSRTAFRNYEVTKLLTMLNDIGDQK